MTSATPRRPPARRGVAASARSSNQRHSACVSPSSVLLLFGCSTGGAGLLDAAPTQGGMRPAGAPPTLRHADGQLPAQRFAFGVVACEPQPRQLEMFNADVRVLEEVRLPRGSCEQFFGQ